GLAAGVTEHDALVAGALVLIGAGIHALSDVGRLLVHVELKLGVLPMEALLLVADLAHGTPCRLLDDLPRHVFWPAHLAGHDDAVGGDERFNRRARMRIGRHVEIDDGIGDAVAYLVGMTFRDGFTREEIISLVRHLILYDADGEGRDLAPA